MQAWLIYRQRGVLPHGVKRGIYDAQALLGKLDSRQNVIAYAGTVDLYLNCHENAA
jgi:hypothetical protein